MRRMTTASAWVTPMQMTSFTIYLSIIYLIAEFYLVDRGLRHRLPGFSSMGRLVILP